LIYKIFNVCFSGLTNEDKNNKKSLVKLMNFGDDNLLAVFAEVKEKDNTYV
jgi:hypothetical protein